MDTTPQPPEARRLLIPKVLYFLFYASIGSYFTYVSLYFRSIGLSAMQIGFMGAVSPLVGLVVTPLWGAINDRFAKPHLLLALAAAVAVLTAWGLSATLLYPLLLGITLVQALFTNPIVALLDGTTLGLLGTRRELYGRLRLWGSVGYILTSFALGLILNRLGLHQVFYGYMLLMSFFMGVALLLPRQKAAMNRGGRRGAWTLVRQPAWAWFSASAMVMSMANNGVLSFLGIYLQHLGAPPSLIGNAQAIGAISEIPVMFVGALLIARYPTRRMIALAYLAYFVRVMFYALMPSPLWALPIALTNGVTFGLLTISCVAYIDQVAPAGTKSLAMGLYYSATGLGAMLGGPLNGWLYDQLGGSAMYLWCAALILVALGLLWPASRKALDAGVGARSCG